MKKVLIIVSALACLTALQAQNITITDAVGQSPETFVRNHLVGNDVFVFNVKYNNCSTPVTIPLIGTFNANGNTNYDIQEGVVLSNNAVWGMAGPNTGMAPEPTSFGYRDSTMASLVRQVRGDGITTSSSIEFDFVSLSNTISCNYIFASNEYYPEANIVGSCRGDVFAILLSGPDVETGINVTRNIASVPGSVTDSTPDGVLVSVNSINNGDCSAWLSSIFGITQGICYDVFTDAYTSYYRNHPYISYDSIANVGIGYGGYTSMLSASAQILPGQLYHVLISICNVGDNYLDSGVLLGKGSFCASKPWTGLSRTTIDTIPGRCGLSVPLTLAQNEAFNAGTVHFAFGGTAIYGVDYELVDERGQVLGSTGLAIDNTEHSFVLRALPGAALDSVKTIELYLATSLCPQYPELVTRDTMRFVLVRGGDVQVADTTLTCSQACFEVSAPLVDGDDATTTYRWEPTTGIDNPYSRTTAAAIFESTDYMLIATGGSGCNSDTALVHVVVTNTTPEPPVGIEDEVGGRKSEVSVWPNPAGDVIHIEAEGLQRVELYSMDGKLASSWQQVAGSGRISLPTEGLANGTYGLRIVTVGGVNASKVVVNK